MKYIILAMTLTMTACGDYPLECDDDTPAQCDVYGPSHEWIRLSNSYNEGDWWWECPQRINPRYAHVTLRRSYTPNDYRLDCWHDDGLRTIYVMEPDLL